MASLAFIVGSAQYFNGLPLQVFVSYVQSLANESCSPDMVTDGDVLEPVKESDDATVAEMSELDSCNTDNTSSVIGPDVASLETSAQPASDDSNLVVSSASVSETVESAATESGVADPSELVGSPSELVVDTARDTGDICDVQNALKTESLETIDTDTIAKCETVDEIGCDPVVTESLPMSGTDMPDTFLSPNELGVVMSGDDAMQTVAECVEIGDTADLTQ